eukprot:TRINITY_DN6544_c0_g1_i4.p1 TRINITY_DN6544_c0_g1~~TRINITY_DN6544_c0_g1_i4.p1  ORF type:complete len:411 (+),score=102.05 TRINITY_DN6544_c0_g1_i4:40-1272(+)
MSLSRRSNPSLSASYSVGTYALLRSHEAPRRQSGSVGTLPERPHSSLENPSQQTKQSAQDAKTKVRMAASDWKFISEDDPRSRLRKMSPPSPLPRPLRPKSTPLLSSADDTQLDWDPKVNGHLLTEEENHLIRSMLSPTNEQPPIEMALDESLNQVSLDSVPQLPSIQVISTFDSLPALPPPLDPPILIPPSKPMLNPNSIFAASATSMFSQSSGSFQLAMSPINAINASASYRNRHNTKLSPVSLVPYTQPSPLSSPKGAVPNTAIQAIGVPLPVSNSIRELRGRQRTRSVGKAVSFMSSQRRQGRRQSFSADAIVNEEFIKFKKELEEYFEDPTVSAQIGGDSMSLDKQFQGIIRNIDMIEIRDVHHFEMPTDWTMIPTIEADIVKRKRGEESLSAILKLQPAANAIL